MKLRVGGKYKTRGGDIVEITDIGENPFFPAMGDNYKTYRMSGAVYWDQEVSFHDLVEEVFEGDEQVIASVMEATSKAEDDTKETYIKILEAMLTQDQLDTAGRILGNLSGNTPKDLYEARIEQVMGKP